MIVAGIDIGAGTTKAVIMDDGQIVASAVIPTGYDIEQAAGEVMEQVLAESGCTLDDLAWIVSTGYGRHFVSYSNRAVSEIICHAKGVHFLLPETEMVIDIGCQDSKIIKIDKDGNVTEFVMNDKCAAGTGRFLEVMANVLGLSIDEMGPESEKSDSPCHISSTCTVFAESEVITLRAKGISRPDLVAGIHQAIARRVMLMATGTYSPKVAFTGGVAKNIGVRKALEKQLDRSIVIPEFPQLTGALGAAVIALNDMEMQTSNQSLKQ